MTLDSTTADSHYGVTAGEIMSTDILTLIATVPVTEVATLLSDRGISGAPVLNRDGTVIGLVSEYDIISKRGLTAADIMSRGVITVTPGTDAAAIAAMMGMHGIRRVPVVEEGKLVGVVSRSDLVRLYNQLRWTCAQCQAVETGLVQPPVCASCGSTAFRLHRIPSNG